jgi:hypothetical protein
MDDTTRAALAAIAALHDGKDFAKLTKADLFEALKRARHMAKVALHEAAHA